ncbi:MAG TPA: hypothetical protein VG605_03280 [Puia sp.]|nr:hypothetical protein [Puia sp.]
MSDTIKILAKIEFSSNETGRQTPFYSGYRPAFTFPNARTMLSGRIDLFDRKSFAKGEVGKVEITFIKGMINDEYFVVGQKFKFAEGLIPIGIGEIIEIIRK